MNKLRNQLLWSKRKNLSIEEQRKIIEEQFQELKDKFLTDEQKATVHLKELPEIYWLVYHAPARRPPILF